MTLHCVLLVDDDPATNFLHRLAFADSGLVREIRDVQSAEAALDYLRISHESDSVTNPRPDLILLDINLPGLDSWQMLQRMRDDGLAIAPIVCIVSTLKHPTHQLQAQSFSEVKDVLLKPLSKDDVVRLIKKHFP